DVRRRGLPQGEAAGLGEGLAAGDAAGAAAGEAAGEAPAAGEAAGLAGGPPLTAGVGNGVLAGGLGVEQALSAISPAASSTSRPRGAPRQPRASAPGTAISDMKS